MGPCLIMVFQVNSHLPRAPASPKADTWAHPHEVDDMLLCSCTSPIYCLSPGSCFFPYIVLTFPQTSQEPEPILKWLYLTQAGLETLLHAQWSLNPTGGERVCQSSALGEFLLLGLRNPPNVKDPLLCCSPGSTDSKDRVRGQTQGLWLSWPCGKESRSLTTA